MINYPDSTIDPAVQELIRTVMAQHFLDLDPTDYAPFKVESMLFSTDPVRTNSYLYLAPITSNSSLKNLKLPYLRRDINEVLNHQYPFFLNGDEEHTVSSVMQEINDSLAQRVVLKEKDFYDTFIVVNSDLTFVELHSRPDSLHYVGHTRVPSRAYWQSYRISFNITVEKYL